MTITQILSASAGYLDKTLADLTVNDQNLGLIALNQVRTQAELLNDFEFNRRLVTLTVDGVTGGSLGALTTAGSEATENLVITGAGTAAANGTYVKVTDNYYVNRSNTAITLKKELPVYVIYNGGTMLYVAGASGTTPVTAVWEEATGALPTPTVAYETTTEVPLEVKSVIEVGLFDTNGNLRPVEWTTVSEGLERERTRKPGMYPRYRTDEGVSVVDGCQRFVFSGDKVYLWPKSDGAQIEIGLEVYAMSTDWTDLDLSRSISPWTTKGSQYLQWQTIIQLNHLFKEFVFRQEGNLPPPKDLADAGLEALKAWDIAQYETYRRHGR